MPSFDIGAMLENALGSYDKQMSQTPPVDDGATVASRELAADHTAATVARYRKKMRFSQNSAYLVRSMSLQLLGILVGCPLPSPSPSPGPSHANLCRRPSKYSTPCPKDPARRRSHPSPTGSRKLGRHTEL